MYILPIKIYRHYQISHIFLQTSSSTYDKSLLEVLTHYLKLVFVQCYSGCSPRSAFPHHFPSILPSTWPLVSGRLPDSRGRGRGGLRAATPSTTITASTFTIIPGQRKKDEKQRQHQETHYTNQPSQKKKKKDSKFFWVSAVDRSPLPGSTLIPPGWASLPVLLPPPIIVLTARSTVCK